MHKRLTSSLRIGVSGTGLTLLMTGGGFRPTTSVVADVSLPKGCINAGEILSELLMTLPKRPRYLSLPTRFVLADELVRFFMVTPPANARNLRDCQAAAAMRFHVLYDEVPNGWQISADWNARQPFLACAVPQPLLDSLRNASKRCQLSVIDIAPQLVAAINCRHKKLESDSWLGVVHKDVLTIAAIEQARLCAVRTTSIPDCAWERSQWLREHLARETLRLNLPYPKQLLLYGALPDHWLTDIAGSTVLKRLVHRIDGMAQKAISPGVALAHAGVRT